MAELKFKHISVGRDGSLWAAAEPDGTVCRLFGDAGYLGWASDKIGKAQVIAAVDWGNAWCVNDDNEIWRLTGAENLDTGGAWTRVPTHSGQADAKTISVGIDGSVWYNTFGDTVYRRDGDGWKRASQHALIKIAALDSQSLWGINHTMRAGYVDYDGNWTEPSGQGLVENAWSLAVGNDRAVWMVTDRGQLYFCQWPMGFSWEPVRSWDAARMGTAVTVAVQNQGDVVCLNGQGDVWRLYDGAWQQIVEILPENRTWTYKVKKGDTLSEIVSREFNLKDAGAINRYIDLIVAQNRDRLPYLTRDKIRAGHILKLDY